MNSGKASRDDLIRENAQLRERLRAVQTSRLSSNITAITKHFVTFGITGWTIVQTAKALAGQMTTADIAIDVGSGLADAIAGLGPAWYLQLLIILVLGVALRSNGRYRRINSELVGQLAEKTRKIEVEKDPNRTTSGLGHDGETHERDVL